MDAYEIGITLALENGVSDGIAAIRRDLAMLDQTIGQTARGLAMLRQAAAGVVAASEADLRRLTSGAAAMRPQAEVRKPEATSAVAEMPVGTPAPALSGQRTAMPLTVAAAPRLLENENGSRSQPGQDSAPPGPMGERGAAPTVVVQPQPALLAMAPTPPVVVSPPAAAPAVAPESVAPALRSRALPEATPAVSVAPVPVFLGGATVATPVPPAVQLPGPSRAPAVIVPTPQRPVQEAGLPPSAAPDLAALGRSLSPPGAEPVMASPRPLPEVASGGSAATPGMPAGPVEMAPAEGAATAGRQAAASGFSYNSAAPPPAQNERSPIQGDVFLDGARVGRWMSDRMARDAARPTAGPTGFDPRRNAAMPGAAVSS